MSAAALDLRVGEPALDAAVRDGLAAVEHVLRDSVQSSDRLADSTARHLVEAGGKRVRPVLALATA